MSILTTNYNGYRILPPSGDSPPVETEGIRFFNVGNIDNVDTITFLETEFQKYSTPMSYAAPIIRQDLQPVVNDIMNSIVGINEEDFRTKFKKITSTDKAGNTIMISLDNFESIQDLYNGGLLNDDVLEITDEEVSNMYIFFDTGIWLVPKNIINIGNINDDTFNTEFNIKVTSVFDVNASPVSFTASTNMDIYIMPAPMTWVARDQYVLTDEPEPGECNPSYVEYSELLTTNHQVTPHHLIGEVGELTSYFGTFGYEEQYQLSELLKQYDNTNSIQAFRNYDLTDTEFCVHTLGDFDEYPISLSSFPYSDIFDETGFECPNILYTCGFDATMFSLIVYGDCISSHCLQMIICKKSEVINEDDEYYYIWAINNT